MMQKSYPSFFLSIYPSYHIYWLVVSKCMKFSLCPRISGPPQPPMPEGPFNPTNYSGTQINVWGAPPGSWPGMNANNGAVTFGVPVPNNPYPSQTGFLTENMINVRSNCFWQECSYILSSDVCLLNISIFVSHNCKTVCMDDRLHIHIKLIWGTITLHVYNIH